MIDFNSEEDIRRLLKSACEPEAPSPEFRGQLLERLTLEAGDTVLPQPRWGRLRLWLPIAVAIILAAIGYGIWLSLNVVPMLAR